MDCPKAIRNRLVFLAILTAVALAPASSAFLATSRPDLQADFTPGSVVATDGNRLYMWRPAECAWTLEELDPDTGVSILHNTTFPWAANATLAAGWLDGAFYLFPSGGCSRPAAAYSYTPQGGQEGTLLQRNTVAPWMGILSLVVSNGSLYVAGVCSPPACADGGLWRFDPADNSATLLNDDMGWAAGYLMGMKAPGIAVYYMPWMGLGGLIDFVAPGQGLASIALLPRPTTGAAAVWDGCSIWTFGGREYLGPGRWVKNGTDYTWSEERSNPFFSGNGSQWSAPTAHAQQAVPGGGSDVRRDVLPSARVNATAILVGNTTYILGGDGTPRMRTLVKTDCALRDADFDGVGDGIDNCPQAANARQEDDDGDNDGDGIGDACESGPRTFPRPDTDADGHTDDVDNCPEHANANQADADGDGRGDACDGNGATTPAPTGTPAPTTTPPTTTAAPTSSPTPSSSSPSPGPPEPTPDPNATQGPQPTGGAGPDESGESGNATAAQACQGCDDAQQGETAAAVRAVPAEVAVTTATAALGAAFLMRHRLAGMLLLGLTRIREQDLLRHPMRMAIVDLVQVRPGIHLKELQRQTGAGRGNLEHHVQALLAANLVREERTGNLRCFFPPSRADPNEVARSGLLRTQRARDLLEAVEGRPGVTLAQLAQAVGCTYRGAAYHVERFMGYGLAALRREGDQLRVYPGVAPPTGTAPAMGPAAAALAPASAYA